MVAFLGRNHIRLFRFYIESLWSNQRKHLYLTDFLGGHGKWFHQHFDCVRTLELCLPGAFTTRERGSFLKLIKGRKQSLVCLTILFDGLLKDWFVKFVARLGDLSVVPKLVVDLESNLLGENSVYMEHRKHKEVVEELEALSCLTKFLEYEERHVMVIKDE